MSEAMMIAIIGFAGAITGPIVGILASSKITNYRLEQLEQEVRKHNQVVARTYQLEQSTAVQEQKISDNTRRIEILEKEVG